MVTHCNYSYIAWNMIEEATKVQANQKCGITKNVRSTRKKTLCRIKQPLRQSLWYCKLQSNEFCVHHSVAMQELEHSLECFALNFDKAVKIIRRDVNKTMCSIVRE
jgi:hypothetical protein